MSTRIKSAASESRPTMSVEALRRHVPAAFASQQFEKTSPRYAFLSTQALVEALHEEGFHPTAARQRWSRGDRLGYARHMIRFGLTDWLPIVDCAPEVILINPHDATSAYELRGGLYRFACTNGLIVSLADFGMIRVPHRGNLVARVIEGARQIMSELAGIGRTIEKMARTDLDRAAQLAFAQRTLELRYRQGRALSLRRIVPA